MGSFDTLNIKLFSLSPDKEYAEKIAGHLGLPLSAIEERHFEDGEHKNRTLENVRNCDVYVIYALYSDEEMSVNDKLCRLLFFLGSLKDASAASVTAFVPYLCYARKDRKTKPRDPVTTRYMAAMFESVGTDRIIVMDVHNLQAYQNSFRIKTEHLEARNLFVNYFKGKIGNEAIVVMSPDDGGVKRAHGFRESLGKALNKAISLIFMEKQRSMGKVSGEIVVGDVKDKTVIIIDDLISTGTTLSRAASACKSQGAKEIYAACTHGIFVGDAEEKLNNPDLKEIVIADTIPPFRLKNSNLRNKLTIIDTTAYFAEAIKRIQTGKSLTDF